MIRALDGQDPAGRGAERAFLAAAEAQPLPGAELVSAWYAFGKGQARGAGGWHFFTAAPDEPPFALALRSGAAWACGGHDPEEWGDFLRYVHARRLTLPAGGPLPQGFAPAARMCGFCLPVRPDTPAPPPLPNGWRLAGLKTAGPLADFLLREGAFDEDVPAGDAPHICAAPPVPAAAAGEGARPSPAAPSVPAAAAGEGVRPSPAAPPVPAAPAGDAPHICAVPPVPAASAAQNAPAAPSTSDAGRQAAALFARELDARAAVGLGYAALLLSPKGQPAAGLAAFTGVHGRAVSLAAVQVRAGLRGRGLGSWLVQTAAAIAHHGGSAVWLLCRPERAGFYTRLGFQPQGGWLCLAPAQETQNRGI